MLIIRYLISGSTAALINFSCLYFLTEYLGLWYLYSTSLAFIISFFFGFFLQKFWTFQDQDKAKIHKQMAAYFSLGLMNLAVNAFLMWILVEKFSLWYMFAQFLTAGFLAFFSFLIYKFFIFKEEL